MLIIALPHSVPTVSSGYAHVYSDGQSVLRHAVGSAATLVASAGEVVAVVPHSRLSWLQVQLPPASHGPRLSSVLHGLLEERLLDEPELLHIVTPAHAQALARTGGATQVVVCDKSWLHQALAPLQAAGLTVQRIVPELSPCEPPVLHVMGEADHAQHLLCHAQGVTLVPPNSAQWHAFAQLSRDDLQLHAEPAWIAAVQHTLQRQPVLQSAAQRWLAASQTPWDLAQGAWAQGPMQRLQRRVQAAWQALRHAPAWRAARWGALALLAVQLLGLNLLAWRESSALDAQQTAMHSLLRATFPSVSVVIDAPLQMQREVDALKQKTGSLTRSDFEPLLASLSTVLPAAQLPTQLHFANQTLRVQGLTLDNHEAAQAKLQAQGLRLRQEGSDTWLLQTQETP